MSISMISEYCSLSAVSEMADSEYELRYASSICNIAVY